MSDASTNTIPIEPARRPGGIFNRRPVRLSTDDHDNDDVVVDIAVVRRVTEEQPQSAPAKRLRRMDVAAVLNAPPPLLDFAVPGLLAGTLGVLVSPGGTGKSMLALQLAVSVAAGADAWGILGEDPQPGPVVLLAAEDPQEIIARRLHALNDSRPGLFTTATMTNLHILPVLGAKWHFGTFDKEAGFQPSQDFVGLAAGVKHYCPRLVILDTFNRLLGGAIEENDNTGIGRLVGELEALAKAPETPCAVMLLHHTNKASAFTGNGDAQQAGRGASALTDNARFQMNLVGLDQKEADARGIEPDERSRWVRRVVSKLNYAQRPADLWMRRNNAGILEPATLPAKRNARAAAGNAAARAMPKEREATDDIPF